MIYRIKEPFAYTDSQGVPRIAQAGDLINERHEAYRPSRVQFMEPIEDAMARAQLETATAAPGERRSVEVSSELDVLRAEAAAAGVQVDRRWKTDRLRKEISAATEPEAVDTADEDED